MDWMLRKHVCEHLMCSRMDFPVRSTCWLDRKCMCHWRFDDTMNIRQFPDVPQLKTIGRIRERSPGSKENHCVEYQSIPPISGYTLISRWIYMLWAGSFFKSEWATNQNSSIPSVTFPDGPRRKMKWRSGEPHSQRRWIPGKWMNSLNCGIHWPLFVIVIL